MSVSISPKLRRKIAEAAKHRCGYCQTSQLISGGQMHIEHIIPLVSGGLSIEANLCLSCAWCNSFKGRQTHAIDPVSGASVALYNPQTQLWAEHFRWSEEGVLIVGMSAIGRATVEALQMNNQFIVPARRQWALAGWHPPQD